MAKLTNVERTFLEGVNYGYRLAADETRRDVEDLMDQLRDARDEVRAELARMRAIKSTVGGERDPSLCNSPNVHADLSKAAHQEPHGMTASILSSSSGSSSTSLAQ